MGNYSDKPSMVRVDFFKESGKWYTTEAIDMLEAWDSPLLIHEAVKQCIIKHLNSDNVTVTNLHSMLIRLTPKEPEC